MSVVVITGGSRGLGASLVDAFLEHGENRGDLQSHPDPGRRQ